MHTNIAHARAVAIKQRPLPCFSTQGDPKKTSLSLRITWLFVVVGIGPLTKTPYKKKTKQNKKFLCVYPSYPPDSQLARPDS